MALLHGELVTGPPRLLDNPIAQVREMLETIHLTDLRPVAPPASAVTPTIQPPPPQHVFLTAQQSALAALRTAESALLDPSRLTATRQIASAAVALALRQYDVAIARYDNVL